MAKINLQQFGGLLPAWEKNLLPPGQAAAASNSDVFSGALAGWRMPKLLRALTNSAAAFVYRVPSITQALATANLVFVTNAAQGDTVKIAENVYTITATVTNSYDVLLGADATETAANLFAALTEGAGVGTVYGTGTTRSPAISTDTDENTLDTITIGATTYPWIMVSAFDIGSAYNTTVVEESTAAARLTWLNDTGSLANVTTTFTGGINPTFDNRITGTSKWLEFEDPDTCVMRSQVVDDQFNRYYISSPSLPPRYNTYDRIQNDEDPWLLGVPAPGCQPGVEVTGGGNAVQLGFPTSAETDTTQFDANAIYLIKITPEAAVELDDISFMPETTSTTANFVGVLYADNAGVPHELLNLTEPVTGAVAGTAGVVSFVNPTGLLAGVDYWIGVLGDTALQFLNGNTGTAAVKFTHTYGNGPPIFLPAAPTSTGVQNLQVWADLTSEAVLASRSYVYTWVTEYGEEGPPSPFTLVNGWNNGSWEISMYTPPADDMGVVRNITKTRIYRTIVGNTGLATYFFVAEIDVATESYADVETDDIIGLNNQLQTTSWFPPPVGLQNVVSMANGMTVGFRANEVWFSEPYHPHAWPPGYVVTTEFPIVGFGVIGQSLVVCTSSVPYVVSGVNPSSMAVDKLATAPCNSRGSIVTGESSVSYCSPDGLVQINGAGSLSITTDLWVTREKWHDLTPPRSVRAIALPTGYYFAFGTVDSGDVTYAQTGFLLEVAPADAPSFAVLRHPGKHRIGFIPLTAPRALDVKNVQLDPWTGTGILIQDGSVYYYDFSDQLPDRMPYTWRSKEFLEKYKINYSAMKVFFDLLANAPTLNEFRMEDPTDSTAWDTLGADRYAYIRVFADGVLVTVRECRKSGELMRILSEQKADTWQIEVEANVPIFAVQVAQSAKALRFL